MRREIIAEMQKWYAENGRRVSEHFDVFNFRLAFVKDPIRGKATIEMDGKAVGGHITFWNKGDVTAIVLNKTEKREAILDDRRLTSDDDISSLLNSYVERILRESTPPE